MTTSASSTLTARKGTLKPHQITGYLAGAVSTAALLSAPQAEAAVTAISFGFGSVLDASDPAFSSFSAGAYGIVHASGGSSTLSLGSLFGTQAYNVGPYPASLAKFFADNTIIGGGGNGNLGIAYFRNDNNSGTDFSTDQLNQNIAFNTSLGNWGWANVSYDAAAKSLAINSAYVESEVGRTIRVGDIGGAAAVPEPSRALLALAGLGGVALRRRRKQAA